MDSIGPTFKKLRERVTPVQPPPSAQPALHDSSLRKRPLSTDDPFYEAASKTARAGETSESGSVHADTTAGAQFLRDSNLRSSALREKSPALRDPPALLPVAEKTPEPSAASSRGQLNTRASRVAKRSEIASKTHDPDPHKNDSDADNDDEVALEVLEEMHKLEECFPVLAERYRLIDKIGEGTFSTVYKAEAVDGTVLLGSQLWKSPPLHRVSATKLKKAKPKNPLVALKQIYVTSSPNRIHNELNLLFLLSGNSHVAPLLDILRYQDQVLAILPFYRHADFRDFYRDLPIKGIKKYMWELLLGLDFVHSKDIIHRDLKPTNFLYDPFKGKGVLVDFGLAEKQQPLSASSRSSNSCPCLSKDRPAKSYSKRLNIKAAYPKLDQRPPRRANRAGTRGFRAPEVLFKCTNQCTKIDIWSAGVIGLSLMARKFPLFNSPDDIDALMEIMLLFGVEKLQKCAELHGCGLELNATDLQSTSFGGNLIKFLATVLHHEEQNGCLPADSVIYDTLKFLDEKSNTLIKPQLDTEDASAESYDDLKAQLEEYNDVKHFIQLLYGCFSMDPSKRLSASQLLALPFFRELEPDTDDVVL